MEDLKNQNTLRKALNEVWASIKKDQLDILIFPCLRDARQSLLPMVGLQNISVLYNLHINLIERHGDC